MHQLRSPLATPDSIILFCLLSTYNDIGDKRLRLQQYVVGVPACKLDIFITKMDQWISTLASIRAVKVALPDASLVWQAFLTLISKIREEHASVSYYMQGLLLENADRPTLATDDQRVLELIDTASKRIAGLISSVNLLEKEFSTHT